MKKIEELLETVKLNELLNRKEKEQDEKVKRTIIWVLAIIGAVAAIIVTLIDKAPSAEVEAIFARATDNSIDD